MLTPSRVHELRTAQKTDTHYARLWRVSEKTVLRARLGQTWASHPTPPDAAPRDPTGCTRAIRAGLPQRAVPRKARRQWRWE